MLRLALSLVALTVAAPAFGADDERGTLTVPADDAKSPIVERFRMAAYTGEYRLAQRFDMRHSGVILSDLTFPSPVKSDTVENNTVYGEYFAPKTPGKVPAVIVLDIMQGNQMIARGEAMWLAQNGVAALVIVLPYYNGAARRAASSSSSPRTSSARSTASGRGSSTAGAPPRGSPPGPRWTPTASAWWAPAWEVS